MSLGKCHLCIHKLAIITIDIAIFVFQTQIAVKIYEIACIYCKLTSFDIDYEMKGMWWVIKEQFASSTSGSHSPLLDIEMITQIVCLFCCYPE